MNSYNDISSMSYTNKDFNSIYVELLEYAKKLSYRWDPTASDESDPGVVLLKLFALIGDKNNYNIDKSVLELMPASVSQIPAARQIFDQCGYSMKHYISAEGQVYITINNPPKDENYNEESVYTYRIPMFTMFTDNESSIVYTCVDSDAVIQEHTADIPLNVIEGSANTYKVNGDALITLTNLDSRNRLYFSEPNIAENGIFICNVNESNYSDWKKVDNLEIQPQLTRCFKFGQSVHNSLSYIEFPDDVDRLFGEGINITYITSKGSDGNVAANKLKKFYTDVKFERVDSLSDSLSEYVSVTTENVYIVNKLPIINGKNPQTIEEAYKDYQKVKNTFDTLVSLKDYTDFMVTSEYASNGYVTDRTNDIQYSYYIREKTDGGTVVNSYVTTSNSNPDMTPFDLCVYALTYVDKVDSIYSYNTSFLLEKNSKYCSDLNSSDIKSIQHNFKDFGEEKILMLKNKYPIKAHVIPRYKLTAFETKEVYANILDSVFKQLNSKNVRFGNKVPYDTIYEAVCNADSRIKAVSIEYPTYETYAVYLSEGGSICEQRIDSVYNPSDTDKTLVNKFRSEIIAKNILSGTTPLFTKSSDITYGASQSYSAETGIVNKVSTATSFSYSASSNSFRTIGANESIILSTPNMIEENSFSSYVKFLYSFNNGKELLANTDIEFEDNEFIVFFWKSADSNEYYDYIKYDSSEESLASHIISSFTYDNNTNIDDSMLSTIQNLKTGSWKTAPNSDLYEYVKGLTSEGSNVISGTRNIKTYTENSALLNANTEQGVSSVSWIVDNIDSATGNAVFPWVWNSATELYEYTLKSGEYLLYTNASKTTLHMLGEGTVLTLNDTAYHAAQWVLPKLSYSDLITNGLDVVTWHTISKVANETQTGALVFTEMERIVLGPGNTLKAEGVGADFSGIPSSGTSLASTAILSYETETGANVSIPSRSNGWTATPVLNINAGPSIPQELTTGQSITIGNTSYSNCKFLCSREIYVPGGSDIDLTKSGAETGVYEGALFYFYNDVKTDVIYYDIIPEHHMITISMPDDNDSSEPSWKLPSFRLPIGTYVVTLNISQGSEHVSKLSLSINSDVEQSNSVTSIFQVETTSGTTTPDINKVYILKVEDSNNISLQLDGNVTAKKAFQININPIIRADYNELFGTNTDLLSSVKSELQKLDSSFKFDYSMFPEEPIDDPLVPESFYNKNHFYNSYVIDQWDSDTMDNISITTNIK